MIEPIKENKIVRRVYYDKCRMDNTWVTLWLVTLVTLVNHNVTRVQRNKKILSKRKKKDICGIVVDQCHNVTQVLPV